MEEVVPKDLFLPGTLTQPSDHRAHRVAPLWECPNRLGFNAICTEELAELVMQSTLDERPTASHWKKKRIPKLESPAVTRNQN